MANQIGYNLGRIINALPEVIEHKLDRVGYIVENKAKHYCHVRTGILRASTTHIVETNKVTIGTNVEYAPIEHEHHPYLQMAFDETRQEVANEFAGLLEEADRV